MKRQYFVASLLVLLTALSLVIILIGCNQSKPELEKIQILNHNMTVQKFVGDLPRSVAIVSGTARNISNDTINQAIIVVTFYDEKGNIIDTASGTMVNLRPGEIWNFSIQTKGTEAWKIVKYDINAQ